MHLTNKLTPGFSLPHGQVETSSNLASVTPIKSGKGSDAGDKQDTYEILCSTRSSLGPALEAVRRRIKKAAELCGASDVLRRQAYPGWRPDLQSNALKVLRGEGAGGRGIPCSLVALFFVC